MRLLMFLDFSQCGVTCKYGKKFLHVNISMDPEVNITQGYNETLD